MEKRRTKGPEQGRLENAWESHNVDFRICVCVHVCIHTRVLLGWK